MRPDFGEPTGGRRRSERGRAILLGGLVLLVGLLLSPGRFHSIDETAMFTAAVNFVDRGEVQVNALGHTLWTPRAGEAVTALAPDGNVYTKKSPLIILLLIPLVVVGRLIPGVGALRAALGLGPLVTAGTAVLLYRLARRLSYSRSTAIVAGLLFAFGTLALPYAQTVFGEPVAGLGLLLALWGLHQLQSRPGVGALICGLGITMASGVNTLYGLLVPLFGGAIFLAGRAAGVAGRQWGGVLGGLLFFPALGGLGLLGYNALRFGSVWETGYHFAGGAEGFTTPLGWGLAGLLVSPAKGFFWYSPPALLALPGWGAFHRREPLLSGVMLGVCALSLIAFGSWWEWWGGWAWGPRFLLPLVPYALVAALPLLQAALNGPVGARLGLLALALWGVGVQVAGAGVDYTRYESELTACCATPVDRTPFLYHHDPALLYDGARSPIVAHWRRLLEGKTHWAADARPAPRLNAIPAVLAERGRSGDVVLYLAPELQDELLDRPALPPIYGLPVQVPSTDSRAQRIFAHATQSARRVWLVTWYPSGDGNNWYEEALRRDWASVGEESLDGLRLVLFARAPLTAPWQPGGAEFGPLRLRSYRRQVSDGTLFVELNWEAVTAPPEDYTLFVHWRGPDGRLLGQQDRAPWGGYRPTRGWQPGEPVVDRFAFPLEEGMGSGSVAIGWYTWPALERLPIRNFGSAQVVDNSLVLPLER